LFGEVLTQKQIRRILAWFSQNYRIDHFQYIEIGIPLGRKKWDQRGREGELLRPAAPESTKAAGLEKKIGIILDTGIN